MNESHDPPGPAFDKARNERDAWRRQQIAALTPDQRKQYDALRQKHDRQIESLRVSLAENEKQQIINTALNVLTEEPRPELKATKDAPKEITLKGMRDALSDFVDGKETRATRRYEHGLRSIVSAAATTVKEAHAREVSTSQNHLQDEHDQLLEACDRERRLLSKDRPPQNPELEKSWREAVVKAARQEAEHPRDHNLTRDFNRSR
jgi:hypothetical protein